VFTGSLSLGVFRSVIATGCNCDGWFCCVVAVLLLHGARFESDLLSLFMGQFCAAQFIEGATRWSAAPMWHKRVLSPR
jgi:hypothetical protein